MADKDKNEITVVAEYIVGNSLGGETVQTHVAAWQLALSMTRPVTATFTRFVRIDKDKK